MRPNTVEDFWRWVDRWDPDHCWLWTGGLSNGYGLFSLRGRPRRAHRFAYGLMVRVLPPGVQLDHLCRVRRCVNPKHLEPVTNQVNVLRGVGPTALNAAKRACIRGHDFALDGYTNRRGDRVCRPCRRERTARWRRSAA